MCLCICLFYYYMTISYNVTGILECVPDSLTITNILKDYGNDIHNYFKEKHGSSGGPYGVEPEVISTFVRSCGGFINRSLTNVAALF